MRWSALSLLVGGVLLSSLVRADSLRATRAQPLKETQHRVTLRIDDGVAKYVVQRKFHNAGERHDEASLGIEMPVGGAGVGLRIKAGDKWFDAELMRREKAAALYEKLTGIGPHPPKDPALLWWEWSNRLHLNIFPIAPGKTSTVEYTLTAPTRYRDGRYFVSYPLATKAGSLSAPMLRVPGGGRIHVDGRDQGWGAIKLASRKLPEWLTSHSSDAGPHYVWSKLDVADDVSVSKLTVTFDVRHTYRSDLRIELRSPDGKWHTLHDRTGSSDNDVRASVELKLKEPVGVKGRWRLVLSDHAGLDVGSLDAWSIGFEANGRPRRRKATDLPLFVPDAPSSTTSGHANISVPAGRIRTLAARLGRVPAAEHKEFSRLEIDVAKPLSPTPKKLSVAFVIDGSHSVEQSGIDAQLAAARSFLRHVPDAHFDAIVYRRHAQSALGGWVSATNAQQRLDRARRLDKLAPNNGSALDAGLRLAAARLRNRPKPRMVVVFSDDLLRPSWTNKPAFAALEQLPEGTTVHVVLPEFGTGAVQDKRRDHHRLAPLAARAGGVLLEVEGVHAGAGKQLDAVTLGLVRPIRIDDFRISGLKLPSNQPSNKRLGEGAGIREMAMLKKAPVEVTLSGKIWARPLKRKVRTTKPFSRATAAFVFSHDMHGSLSTAEQLQVAMMGRAVSPVTSYLAIEPGVRPSRIGLEGVARGVSGAGLGARSSWARGGSVAVTLPKLKDRVRPLLQQCKQSHPPKSGWHIELVVHTTFREIVDVVLKSSADKTSRCVVDAVWGLQLESAFHLERHQESISLD